MKSKKENLEAWRKERKERKALKKKEREAWRKEQKALKKKRKAWGLMPQQLERIRRLKKENQGKTFNSKGQVVGSLRSVSGGNWQLNWCHYRCHYRLDVSYFIFNDKAEGIAW